MSFCLQQTTCSLGCGPQARRHLSRIFLAMNEFQENVADTAERALSERHMEAVRQQGGMFVEAVRVTRMPMLVTDAGLPGNPIIFANRAFVQLSGYTEDELLGQDPHFMNGEQTDPDAIRQYESAIKAGRDETLEILQYRKDGTPFRAMLFASPLDDGQGKVTNHFLSYLAITLAPPPPPLGLMRVRVRFDSGRPAITRLQTFGAIRVR